LFGDGPASAQSPRPSPTPTTVTRRRRRKERRRAYLPSGMYRRPRLPEPDTPVGAILAERRAGLVADLGGEGELTTTQTALIDLVIRQWSILDSVDGYLLGMESLVDRRHRKAWPVVLDRDRLAASLERSLGRLGLERRTAPPAAPAKEVWCVAGRRGGKSRVAALVAVYLSCFRRYRLAPGETGTLMVIAVDKTQAKVVFSYIRALVAAVPMLARMVTGE